VIVLDASALVDVVLDQSTAAWVLDEIAEQEVCAPAHQPAEVLSALARLVRATQIGLESARDALDDRAAGVARGEDGRAAPRPRCSPWSMLW